MAFVDRLFYAPEGTLFEEQVPLRLYDVFTAEPSEDERTRASANHPLFQFVGKSLEDAQKTSTSYSREWSYALGVMTRDVVHGNGRSSPSLRFDFAIFDITQEGSFMNPLFARHIYFGGNPRSDKEPYSLYREDDFLCISKDPAKDGSSSQRRPQSPSPGPGYPGPHHFALAAIVEARLRKEKEPDLDAYLESGAPARIKRTRMVTTHANGPTWSVVVE